MINVIFCFFGNFLLDSCPPSLFLVFFSLGQVTAREKYPHFVLLFPADLVFQTVVHIEVTLGTLSKRRHRPDNGNRKHDISFETPLRMYKMLLPDIGLK